jgi:cell fate regulator YaaT (PSP1 superfamily)
MPQTVEVRFKGIRRDFFRWPDDQDPLRLNEVVVVECDRGEDLGRVHTAGEAAARKCGGACTGCEIGTADKAPLMAEGEADERASGPADTEEKPPQEPPVEVEPADSPPIRPSAGRPDLRPVLRRATPDEIRTAADLRRAEEDARRQAGEKARRHKLEMKITDTEWQWDRSKLMLYFTAETRVDFRALVRDLASMFRTRIELRQIGVRDEAARLGGVGRCGREYCCSTWLSELSPVSLALAKDQHLSLNPAQISGGCGRLLCCLKYEHEFYVAARKRFPREGKMVVTARGAEKVVAVDIFRERVFLRHEEGARIIPLVDLRQEMEAAAALGPLPPPPTSPPAPRPQRSENLERPSRRPTKPPSRRPAEPPSRPAAEPPTQQAAEPPSRPAAEPPTHQAAEPPSGPPAAEPTASQAKRRRRRRGRRGGRGGPGGPSSGPPTPEV